MSNKRVLVRTHYWGRDNFGGEYYELIEDNKETRESIADEEGWLGAYSEVDAPTVKEFLDGKRERVFSNVTYGDWDSPTRISVEIMDIDKFYDMKKREFELIKSKLGIE